MRRRLIRGAARLAIVIACLAGGAAGWAALSPLPLRAWVAQPRASLLLTLGENPYPVQLRRPPVAPLSAMAQLGSRIFADASLSSSGQLSCASCHSPSHAYGPPNAGAVMLGGAHLASPGVRAVPSLTYLERQPNFSIGPDNDENETVSLAQMVSISTGTPRAQKTATDTAASAANLVPQGGLFWDGRSDTLQDQALYPLTNPLEMDNPDIDDLARRLQHARYADRFVQLFGPAIFEDPRAALAEAMFAVARFQIEDPSFHPYSSKFDSWLEGKARLSQAEMRGYLLFNNPDKANCGGCHVDQVSSDRLPPLFTDHQFEALAVPRNAALAANADPHYFDRGLCGPYRTDIADQTQYCAMFLTPTLRNTALRHAFFHNGVYTTLQQVMDFYDFRDTEPGRVYPRGKDGKVAKYDDVPVADQANVDVADPPFDRTLGQKPAMTAEEERDIIAFMQTLTDGYAPTGGYALAR